MIKYGKWDLPGLDYFMAKNSFKGSNGNFRFNIDSDGDKIIVYIWSGEKCFEKSEIIEKKEFELVEQSLFDINGYLTEKDNFSQT